MAINIDKGVLKGLALLIGVVALLGSIFIALYIWAIVGGSMSYIAINGTTTTLTAVTGEGFIARNDTNVQLDHYPILSGTLSVYNATPYNWALSNFSINYALGLINLTADNNLIVNGTTLYTNYTYSTTTGGALPVTNNAKTFLGTSETAFFANLTSIQTAAAVAGGLLVLAIILILFASFIKTGKEVYGEMKSNKGGKGKGGDLSY